MKKYLLLFFLVFSLAACTNTPNSNEATSSGSKDTNDAKIQELQNENTRLKEQLKNSPGEGNTEGLRESLNLTFKLLDAMGSKDYDFIESVSSPNVKVSREKNIFTVKNGEDTYEVAFQSKMNLEDLEFRGYEAKDKNHIQLFMSRMFNQNIKGSEGYGEINFGFIHSDDGRWLLDKFITN